jgi:hypothetical protein
MQMRDIRQIVALAALLALAGSGAQAQTTQAPRPAAAPAEATAPSTSGVVTLGGLINDDTGYLGRLAEYDRIDNGGAARFGVQLWGDRNGLAYDLAGTFGGDQSDQDYRMDVNLRRWLKAHVSYVRTGHRLDHDPIDYVDAASGIGGTFVVQHTDFDPTAAYRADRGALDARVDIAPPELSWLRLFASHRQELRHGARQSLTTSHCATCHLKSNSRSLDEKTREYSGGFRVLARRLSMEYAYEDRRFSDDAASLRTLYDPGVHPATLADVFYNRLQYDARDGEQPFDVVPGLKKSTHALKGRLDLPREAAVVGNFTRSTVTNTDTAIATDYTGGSTRFVVPIGTRAVIQGAFRRYTMDTDSVFIDVVEPIAPAGPTAGKTYDQAYTAIGSPDYWTAPASSRTPTDFNLEVAVRPAKRTTLRAGYRWEQIERTAFAVSKTTTNTLLFSGRGRAGKRFQWRARLDSDWTTDPFANENAALPAVLQPFMSPNNVPFTGLQYDTMYASRSADLTSFPTRSVRTDEGFTWTPTPKLAVTGHYRWQSSSNDDLTVSSWDRSVHAPGAELYLAAGERWTLMAGYQYQRERLETMFSTLAFVG